MFVYFIYAIVKDFSVHIRVSMHLKWKLSLFVSVNILHYHMLYYMILKVILIVFLCISVTPCVWWVNSNEELCWSGSVTGRRLLCYTRHHLYTPNDAKPEEKVSEIIV